jgi:hypothetical protein
MTERQARLQQIREDALELLDRSREEQLRQLDILLERNGDTILNNDSEGPMAMPKNIVVALHLYQAWQWGPSGCRIQISTSSSASNISKRARSFIEVIRRYLP